MKITLIQTELSWENQSENIARFEKKIAQIKGETDIILLPEMFTTGFSMNAKALAEKMDGTTVQWLKKKAVERNCAITGSLIIEENGKFYNRLIWADPEHLYIYNKRHLFSYAKEDHTYTSGNKKEIIQFRGWNILPLICYDLRFPVWSRRTKESNYDLLLYVANWPERRKIAWKTLLPARAIENQSFVAGLNRIGNDGNEIYHSGDSAVYNYKGEMLTNILPTADATQTIEINLEELIEHRKHFAFFDDADNFTIN